MKCVFSSMCPLLFVLLVAPACFQPDTTKTAAVEEATEAEPAEGADEAAEEKEADDLAARAEEAEKRTSHIIDRARAYYEGDQAYHPNEPWFGTAPDEPREHDLVPFKEKVFPGGTDIRIVSAPTVPDGRTKVPFEPRIEGQSDLDVNSVLDALRLDIDEDVYFRFTYETGPGTGKDATARVTAEANFDPATPEHHTIVQELHMTVSDGIVASPPETKNELQ